MGAESMTDFDFAGARRRDVTRGNVVETVVFYIPNVFESSMTFRVLEVGGLYGEDILFQGDDEDVEDPSRAFTLISGWVKADGCSDFDIGDERSCSYRHHICGREGAEIFARAFDAIYELVETELKQ